MGKVDRSAFHSQVLQVWGAMAINNLCVCVPAVINIHSPPHYLLPESLFLSCQDAVWPANLIVVSRKYVRSHISVISRILQSSMYLFVTICSHSSSIDSWSGVEQEDACERQFAILSLVNTLALQSRFCFLSLCRLHHLPEPTTNHRVVGVLAVSSSMLWKRRKRLCNGLFAP